MGKIFSIKTFKHITLTLLISALLCSMLSSCDYLLFYSDMREINEEKEFVSDINNFVTATGTIQILEIHSGTNGWYLQFDKLENIQPNVFPENYFVFLKLTTHILEKNGFFEECKPGDTITFIAAPCQYLPYPVPIVSVSKGDKVYLDFETGYKALMKSYESLNSYRNRW